MYYLGRKLPLEIRYGNPGEVAPAYVSGISRDTIEIAGTPQISIPASDLTFAERSVRMDLNAELSEKMIRLALAGIAFSYDDHGYWSPASLMREWQEEGKFNHSFYEISWRAPDRWLLTTIPVPEAGIRGWEPKARQ
ncbi:hypothetical protein ACK9YZ_14345 [Rhizobium sp. ZK1]|uniref:hypothetical protein n=1 Tax=Rhizobium sp. ZK1 TaxID=3389872 RepID=UPI0039F68FAA